MTSITASADLPSRDSMKHGRRIMAWKKQGVRPLIDAPLDAPLIGGLSPSESALVERHDLKSRDWEMFVHSDQGVCRALTSWPLKHAAELSVRVSDGALDKAAHSRFDQERTGLATNTWTNDIRIRGLLDTLEAERACGYPSGQLFLDSIETALAALVDSSSIKTFAERKPTKGGLIPRRLNRVLDFMHANIDRQIRLSELARCAGMSLSHFSHQFRASTNTSPYQYMLSLRIERGKKMLRNQNASVLDVALATGFENPQHFATVFRRIVGVSPSNYRRQS